MEKPLQHPYPHVNSACCFARTPGPKLRIEMIRRLSHSLGCSREVQAAIIVPYSALARQSSDVLPAAGWCCNLKTSLRRIGARTREAREAGHGDRVSPHHGTGCPWLVSSRWRSISCYMSKSSSHLEHRARTLTSCFRFVPLQRLRLASHRLG